MFLKKFFPLLLLTLLLAVGCKSPVVDEGVTSYTLINKINFAALGYGIDATIYEYDAADHRLDSNIILQPEFRKEYTFYPADTVDHLKLKLTSTEHTVRWAGTIFYLIPGQNIQLIAGISLISDPNAYTFNAPMP